jgi:hypothetical protein
VFGGETGGKAAAQGVCDQRRLLRARLSQQLDEPLGKRIDVQVGDRLRLPEAGHVGDDQAVALGKGRKHWRPDRTAALDPAMQEHERGSSAALENCRGQTSHL